jgi:hypothetical protein
MLDTPVLCQAAGTGISLDKAWQYNSFQSKLKTLGQATYCERRETGNLLNSMQLNYNVSSR